jgi:lipid-binding SYLF domain-containing protein
MENAMKKRSFLLAAAAASALALSACSTTGPSADKADPASKRTAIDAGVDNALANLYAQAPGSRELVAKASGVLVFPSVVSAGFVVGGSYGQGALRVGGKSTGYYSTAAGSVGLLAGAETKSMYILFMTPEALAKFQASNGWTAGVDASVTLVKVGAEASGTTATAQEPVIGYVLTKGGLMANLSFDGTKITRLEL